MTSRAADVDVWFVDLGRCREALLAVEAATPRLPPGHGLVPGGTRHLAHIALRLAIESAVGPAWRGAPFDILPGGRPELPAGADGARPASFSLSHTETPALGGVAVIALGPRGPLGIDIELPRQLRMGERHLAAIRRAANAVAPGQKTLDDRVAGANQTAWCRLEAVAKADGCGMARLLSHLGARGHGELTDDELTARADAWLGRLGIVVRDLDVLESSRGSRSAIAHPRGMSVGWASFPATEHGIAALVGR